MTIIARSRFAHPLGDRLGDQVRSRRRTGEMIWLFTRCRGSWFCELLGWLLLVELARFIGG
jgi:hypothetical protein